MKAAVLHEFGGQLAIEQMPVREPDENQILVKVVSCGVCHTDLHACQGDWPVKPKTDTKPGEWVAISGIGGLGQCRISHARKDGLFFRLYLNPR
jgi:alcohol dehydrogenase, propanol-preferring